MRKTIQQLEAEARETEVFNRRRQEIVDRYTPDTAERLAYAAHGSYYTNPEVTAALGLSDAPVDFQAVHTNSAVQAAKYAAQLKDRRAIAANSTPDSEFKPPFTIVDLLRIDPQELAIRSDKAPKWWDQVDPEGFWRWLPVPTEIKDAKDLLQLDEAQVVKLFLSKTRDEWYAIPGMIAKGTYDIEGNRVPGSFDAYADLGAKFPTLRDMWTAQAAMYGGPKPWSGEAIAGSVIAAFNDAVERTMATAQLPFKALSFATPDHIGPVGLTGIGEQGRALARGAVTPLVSAAQFTKSTFEYAMTHRGALSALGVASIPTAPEDLEDYKKVVIEGNVLSQIAMNAVKNRKIDLGTGFFPEGKLMEDARAAHDAGLPKIEGQTWTVGRASVEPFIKEGYIDRNGYMASLVSGLIDGTFTLATDPSLTSDPIQSLMKRFNLKPVSALTVLHGEPAARVEKVWADARRAAGASTVPKDIIDLPYYAAREVGEEAPRFAGILPEGTTLPDDVEAFVQKTVDDTVRNLPLAAMDNPPNVQLPELFDNNSIKERLGVIDPMGETPRFVPREIDAMPYTREGRVTLEKLTTFDNVGQLYDHFLGKIPPGLAVAIQDVVDTARAANKEVDLADIHRVLRDGVYSGDPMYNIREIPGVYRRWINQTGKAIAHWTTSGTRTIKIGEREISLSSRQLAMMPRDVWFTYDDPINSLNDMNRLMTVMNVAPKDRHAMLSKAMKTVANGEVDRRFELQNELVKTILAAPLRANGVPEDWIAEMSNWKGLGLEYQWSFDAIGQGYPTAWLADGTGDILRTTDMMSKGFMMIAPDKLRQAIANVTNLWEIFKPFRGNPAMEKMLRATQLEAIRRFQANWLKPFALGAPLPVKMAAKILMEERARMAIFSSVDETGLKALSAFGDLNYNTMGVELKNAKEIEKVVARLEQLDLMNGRIRVARREAQRARDLGVGVQDAEQRLATLIDERQKFVTQYGNKKQMKAEIDTFNARINESLPGTGRKLVERSQGLMSAEMGNPQVQNWVRQKPQAVYRDVQFDEFGRPIIDPETKNNRNWVTGTARDIAQMSQTREYREVAKAMLAGGATAVEQLPNRFLYGDLKNVFDEIWAHMLKTQGAKGMSATTPLTTIEGQMLWIRTIYNDILTRTMADPVAIGVVATGKFGDKSVLSMDTWKAAKKIKTVRTVNVYEPIEDFRTWVKQNLLEKGLDPNKSPIPAPYAEDVLGENRSLLNNQLLSRSFRLYREPSNYLNRGPLQRFHKWKRILELMPAMDAEEARKMVQAIDKTDAPQELKNSLRNELPYAAGTATRKQVEILGEMHGDQVQADLLGDFSNRSYFGYRHSLYLAFADAWKEAWSVWMRLMAQSPSTIEKLRQGKEGLEGTSVPEWAGGLPGQTLLTTDEDTGESVVVVPFSRNTWSLLGLNAQDRIKTRNLTLLGGLPGAFGVGGMILNAITPNSETFQGFRSVMFPISTPTSKAKIADYFLPSWAQQIGTALASMGGNESIKLFDNLQQMFTTDMNDSIRASTMNSILTNIASNKGDVPLTAEERDALLEDALKKTDYLSLIKGFFNIIIPGSSMTKYFTDMGAENVTTGYVMDDFRKAQDDAKAQGKNYNDAVMQMLEKYGSDFWIYLAGSADAKPGMQATAEYGKWQRENGAILEKYPLVGGWLGPQTGEFDPKMYNEQRSSGQRTPRNIEQRQEKALKNLANSIYRNYRDTIIRNGLAQGFTEKQVRSSTDFAELSRSKRDELMKEFPMWDPTTQASTDSDLPNQIIQIEKMIKDPKVLATPAGKALKDYWDYRTALVNAVVAQDPGLAANGWRTKKGGINVRFKLEDVGSKLAEQYPEFAPLWENILSNEYSPPELGM